MRRRSKGLHLTSSSNDLLADRRYAWAAALAGEGDHAAAADLLEQVVERVPGWAAAWAALAEARERGGQPRDAALAWRQVAALDPAGRLGGSLNLARLEGRTPAAMPQDYVRALFDDYAPRFERHLVETLGYDGPGVVAAALDRAAQGRHFARVLDLGCGTGLMARALAERAADIDGIDLSPAMVDLSRATGLYRRLSVAPLDAALSDGAPAAYDLVVAADVFVYVGELGPNFGGAARVLVPGGLLAFTVQAFTTPHRGPRAYELGPDLRFAHAPDYVEAMLDAAGLAVLRLDAASVRGERGKRIPGLVAVACKA